jgi:hypothetical protein
MYVDLAKLSNLSSGKRAVMVIEFSSGCREKKNVGCGSFARSGWNANIERSLLNRIKGVCTNKSPAGPSVKKSYPSSATSQVRGSCILQSILTDPLMS